MFANYHFISHLKKTTIQYPNPIRNNRPHITGNMQPSPNKASNTVKQIMLYSFFISFSCNEGLSLIGRQKYSITPASAVSENYLA